MGIMGLFPEIPIIPAFPEIPENSPKKAKLFNNINLPKHHNRISCQKGSDATLGKKNADGLYFGVLPIRIYFC